MFAATSVSNPRRSCGVWAQWDGKGVNLSGNNQPDYQEPYLGPLSTTQFGGSLWATDYVAIRDANIVIDGAPKVPDMSTAEKALEIGVAQTAKALMFLYLVQTRAHSARR